jgi:very-short-patch-repair endonuclease
MNPYTEEERQKATAFLLSGGVAESFEHALDLIRGNFKPNETQAPRPVRHAKSKDDLEAWLRSGGFGRVETEYRFHPIRKWRADYALIDQHPIVLIEYDGLLHQGENASHASISGILRDAEKSNAAVAMGFRYFRTNAKFIQSGEFYTFLNDLLEVIP